MHTERMICARASVSYKGQPHGIGREDMRFLNVGRSISLSRYVMSVYDERVGRRTGGDR